MLSINILDFFACLLISINSINAEKDLVMYK